MKELSALEVFHFAVDIVKTNLSIVVKCTFSPAPKWSTQGYSTIPDIPSAVNYSALGLHPRALQLTSLEGISRIAFEPMG